MCNDKHSDPTIHDQQIALALMAHAARHDEHAVEQLLDTVADNRPIFVISALLGEFQQGMDMHDAEELAEWFADKAVALATGESTN